MKIHHLGVVTSNVEEALKIFGLTRSDIKETVYDPNQDNNLHFIHLEQNNLWLELVEPMSEKASTHKFAKKHEIGLHHIAREQNLQEAEEQFQKMEGAFPLGRYAIDVKSFGGKIKTLFIAIKGLIVEFVEPQK